MEERAPEWSPGGAYRPHYQVGRPLPLGLYKQPPPIQIFAHTPTQNSPSSFCSAASRERKLRKRVEKKSKDSLALNFSLTP
jgi:hypothetical protein